MLYNITCGTTSITLGPKAYAEFERALKKEFKRLYGDSSPDEVNSETIDLYMKELNYKPINADSLKQIVKTTIDKYNK